MTQLPGRKFVACIVVLGGIGAGCCSNSVYRKADQLTYDAIAGEYVAFVGSSKLDKDAKERRYRAVRGWADRLAGAPVESGS